MKEPGRKTKMAARKKSTKSEKMLRKRRLKEDAKSIKKNDDEKVRFCAMKNDV